MTTRLKLDQALTALQAAQAQVEQLTQLLRRFPTEPPAGTVLRFQKTYPVSSYDDLGATKTYDYVALRLTHVRAAASGGRVWYLTGRNAAGEGRGLTWDKLVEFIGDSAVEVAVAWHDLEQWYTSQEGESEATPAATDASPPRPWSSSFHLFAPVKADAWDEGHLANARGLHVNPYRSGS